MVRQPGTVPKIASSVVGSVVTVLGGMGIDVASLGGGPDEVFERAAERIGEPLLGVKVAEGMPVGAFGLVEYGLLASSTVREALGRLIRYYPAMTERVRLELGVLEGKPALFFIRRAGITHSRHWIELSMRSILDRFQNAVGGADLLEQVRFSHAIPEGKGLSARYAGSFGAPVVFDCPEDAMVLRSDALAKPLWTSAKSVAAAIDTELGSVAERTDGWSDPLRMRVRVAVLEALSEGKAVTLPAVAARVGMPGRSLQRQLAERGSSLSDEIDRVRRERALALVKAGYKTAAIAAELGYRTPSTFFRAYRRWTGDTPASDR